MYKNVCHKIIVYVLVGCLSFGVPATTYYKSVHAIEFLGGALAFEEALKWLLAIVGVTAVGSVASEVDWSDVRDQCVEVQLQKGASQVQVSEWWAKLSRGTLDKASSCWSSFKEWANSLTESESGSGSATDIGFTSGMSASSVCSLLNSTYGTHISVSSSYANESVAGFIVNSDSPNKYVFLFVENTLPTGVVCSTSSTGYCNFYTNNTVYMDGNGALTKRHDYGSSSIGMGVKPYIITDNIPLIQNGHESEFEGTFVSAGSGSGSVSSDWRSAIDVAKQNLELFNRDLPDENASEVAIPMPGLADSDNDVSADAYDNIIDAINDGTITLDDGIAQIQDLLHVLVIDDTTDIVQPVRPDPDTGEDQTKEDVIKENKSNMGFTLAGLEKVFPFCIPFDIYAFMTLLVAEPVAPEFDFPIKSVNNQTEEIHIDLSPFEPVAVVVRYIFDFLFIIGLALMTRGLIGGGSSD